MIATEVHNESGGRDAFFKRTSLSEDAGMHSFGIKVGKLFVSWVLIMPTINYTI